MAKTFILIDGHALIYRAYHAFTTLTSPSGELVNAVYGFSRILLTVIRELKPEYIAVAFDHPQPTFRHADFSGYKANRVEMPDDLRPQIEIIKKIVTAFNMPQFVLPGYEADDLIGTLSYQASQLPESVKGELKTIIVTGDRDSFQLVNDRIHVWMPGRTKPTKTADTEYDTAGVLQKMGVRPDQIIDLKALMGDASDNIPGVSGIGEKTAQRLLNQFNTLEAIYTAVTGKNTEPLTADQKALLTPKIIEKLAVGHADATLSKQLATIDQKSPVTLEIESCRLSTYDKQTVLALFEEFDFKSLMKMLPADEFEMGVQSALF